jgi:hypothetical protein
MPTISTFYGIFVIMVYMDDKEHKKPHIHVSYQDDSAVLSIPDGEILAGSLPQRQLRMIRVWMDLRREDLLANWNLAVVGKPVVAVAPLII